MSDLIDSSAWIQFLRDQDAEIESALHAGTAAMCPVVWLELWSGARGKREENILKELRGVCEWLEMDGEVWEHAAELAQMARQSGLNCPLADLLITACANRHRSGLIHRGKHFEALLKLCASR